MVNKFLILTSHWSLLFVKVPEVKDTVHKHSLLYHLTFSVLESLPTASDLYSEIGPITRASRYDVASDWSTLIT